MASKKAATPGAPAALPRAEEPSIGTDDTSRPAASKSQVINDATSLTQLIAEARRCDKLRHGRADERRVITAVIESTSEAQLAAIEGDPENFGAAWQRVLAERKFWPRKIAAADRKEPPAKAHDLGAAAAPPAADDAAPAATAPSAGAIDVSPALPAIYESAGDAGVQGASLAIYDSACKKLAEAVSMDEAKEIRDQAVAWATYARQAKNRKMEADAVVLRMRAMRRLDQLRQAQSETVGLNRGTAGAGRPGLGGLAENPPNDMRPTLASQGIDKNLAHQGRVLGALSDAKFEETLVDMHDAVTRAVRRVVQIAEIDQERERAEAFKSASPAGCVVDDLTALAESGYRAGAILVDPPWPFATWTHLGFAGDKTQQNRAQRSRAAPYPTMSHEDIYKLPVESLAADDCILFLWIVQTQLPQAFECVKRWGFELKSVAFAWPKGEDVDDIDDLHVPIGAGYWTRAGFEQCWLATRGKPRRLHADVRQVIIEPRREHSRKPDCIFERIERLIRGPFLELFARPTSPGLIRSSWTCWGDEIPCDQFHEPAPAAAEPPAAAAPEPDDGLAFPAILRRPRP